MNRSRMWLLTLLLGIGVLPGSLWLGVASADQTTYTLGVAGSGGCRVVTKWDFPPCAQVTRSQRSAIASPSAFPWVFVVSAQGQSGADRSTGGIDHRDAHRHSAFLRDGRGARFCGPLRAYQFLGFRPQYDDHDRRCSDRW